MMGKAPNFIARSIAVIVVCAAAWPLGSVAPEHQYWMAQAVTVCVLVSIFARESLHIMRMALSSALPLLGVGLLIGALQIVPLPNAVVETISASPELRKSLSSNDAESQDSQRATNDSSTSTISIYPTATRRDLSLLVIAFALAYVGMTQFQTAGAQLALCVGLAVNGAALSIWGIVQSLSDNPVLLPGMPVPEHGVVFSTYVNHSSAAGYINIGLAAAIGLLLWSWRNADLTDTKLQDGIRRWIQFVCTPATLASIALAAVCLAGVLISMSRGGFVSTVAALAGLLMLLFFTRKKMASPVLVSAVFLSVIGIIGWLGFSDQISERLATLNLAESAENTRVAHWKDGLQAAWQFPLTGSGLGTYRYAYLPHDSGTFDVWYRHAHNQYLEALVDAGIPGALLLLMLCFVAIASAVQLRLKKSAILHHWFACAGFFLLLSQGIHALADFGLYHPANMAAAALFCGALCGTAALFSSKSWMPVLRMPRFLSYPFVWGAVSFGLCLLATQEFRGWWAADRIVFSQNDPTSLDEFDAAIADAQQAVNIAPDDADLHLKLSSLWVARYRHETATALKSTDQFNDYEIGGLISLRQIHGRLVSVSDAQRNQTRAALLDLSTVKTNLVPAWESLQTALELCPFTARGHVNAALLSPLFGGNEKLSLQHAETLSGSNMESNYDIGRVHYQARRYDDMLRVWRRSLEISPRRLPQIFGFARSVLPSQRIANELVPADAEYVMQIANSLSADDMNQELRGDLARRAIALLSDDAMLSPDEFQLRSAAHSLVAQFTEAENDMHRAVRARPNNLEWRFQYAALLAQNGQFDKAREHITWCLRLQPHTARFQQLLNRIDAAESTA